jgi:hypothetical protein
VSRASILAIASVRERLGTAASRKGGEQRVSRASLQILLVTVALVVASVVGFGFPDGP